MSIQLMESDGKKSLIDPRTKILLLILISVFVLGGTDGEAMKFFCIILSVLPFVLLFLSGKIKICLSGLGIICAGWAVQMFLLPISDGSIAFIIAAVSGIIIRFVPSIMMGRYLVSTTTVSEFIAAMERIHMTEKITIPLSVMFRFFPTVQEEFNAINSAMKMRGISFRGKKKGKFIEYRIVPLMTCCVRIGDELSAAALTRGLDSSVKRTNICNIGFNILDYILLIFSMVTIVFWFISLSGVL